MRRGCWGTGREFNKWWGTKIVLNICLLSADTWTRPSRSTSSATTTPSPPTLTRFLILTTCPTRYSVPYSATSRFGLENRKGFQRTIPGVVLEAEPQEKQKPRRPVPDLPKRVLAKRRRNRAAMSTQLPWGVYPIMAERREHLPDMQGVAGESGADESRVKDGILIY